MSDIERPYEADANGSVHGGGPHRPEAPNTTQPYTPPFAFNQPIQPQVPGAPQYAPQYGPTSVFQPPAPVQSRNTAKKWVLAGVIGAVLLCLVSCGATALVVPGALRGA